jgi:hypothetical protein
VNGYVTDTQATRLLTELAITGHNAHGYTIQVGVIRYKGRIWLGAHKEDHRAVLLDLHNSSLGGHSGIQRTYSKVKKLLYWPNMKNYIIQYV